MAPDRRELLKTGFRLLPAALAGAPILRGLGQAPGRESGPQPGHEGGALRTPSTVDRYIDPLPVPPLLKPSRTAGGEDRFEVRMTECAHHFHSQLPPARVWGYGGIYPGPTIEACSGRAAEVHWINALPSRHLFPVDPAVAGAMGTVAAVRTVPHLHGASTPSESDGLPERWFPPGGSVRFRYPNRQPAATLWYHDHAMGITRLNLYAGLSGIYLLRDERERGMDLPSGRYELPLVVQDRTLDDQGQLVYAPTGDGGRTTPPGRWGPQFYGRVPVVNGALYPYLDVEPRPYRLRLLNAANARFFRLYLNLAASSSEIPRLVTFHQIGGDGGLLPRPASLERLLLAPAERADLIVDLSGLEGRTVTLMNDARAPYPGWDLIRAPYPPLSELMQLRVVLPLSPGRPASGLPPPLPPPPMDPQEAAVTRDFVLTESTGPDGAPAGMRINGRGYADPVTEFPLLGSMERWRFINMTDDTHPMHLHLVQFRILERQGFNYGSFLQGRLELVGSPRPPAANETGRKDTAIVNPREVLTILVPFTGYAGRYVYHCHMAEHEDNEMMRPYEVVAGPRTQGAHPHAERDGGGPPAAPIDRPGQMTATPPGRQGPH